jgi:hypothetical protein
MADEPERQGFSLKRWSQRKHAAAREAPPVAAPAPSAPAPATAPATTVAGTTAEAAAPAALPPVESLTFDADFTAFMKADVEPELRRAALKKLFSDPRFNVMDGLDVYIDDYTKFEPLDAETARSLVSARYIFDPPKTRVNDAGVVEDVPPEEAEAKSPEDAEATASADVDAPAELPAPADAAAPAALPDVTPTDAVAPADAPDATKP